MRCPLRRTPPLTGCSGAVVEHNETGDDLNKDAGTEMKDRCMTQGMIRWLQIGKLLFDW